MGEIKYQHTNDIHNSKDALEILPFVFKYITPKSIIDIGCGNGSWLAAAKILHVKEVLGVDGIKVDNNDLLLEEKEFLKHDLTKPLQLDKKFDLAISLEVAEHLPESASNTFVETICNHSDVVLFSAAIPNQGGQFHINEQWPEYWHQKFIAHGFFAYDILRQEFWDHKNVLWWYSQNMIIYAKKNILDTWFIPNNKVNGLVHPSSYKRKINHPRYIKSKSELIRLMSVTLKWFLKRVIGKSH